MELRLNIYKHGAVEKTYTANHYDIMFGTMEDIVNLIDLDVFNGSLSDNDMIQACIKMISGALTQVKELLQEIFPGVTEEELRRVKLSELLPLAVELVKFSLLQMNSISPKGKN